MHALRSFALLLISLGVCLASPAAATPYGEWAFDVQKAERGDDLDALAKLAQATPGFARVWFYGQVLDLVTEGVPDAVRETIRPRLQRVAEALAKATPPDNTPLLFLDRVDSGVLAIQAPLARKMQKDAISAVRANTPIGASLAVVDDPELAGWVFSTLLYRANLANKRLGGAQEAQSLLKVAQRTAEGFALALDDIGPWQTLLKWNGGAMPQERDVLESGIAHALTLYAGGKKTEASAQIASMLNQARRTRGQNLITALLLNGVANSAGWTGDRKAEKAARVKVLQAVRPLGRPGLVALVTGQLVRAHIAEGTLREMLPFTEEMRKLGKPVTEVGVHLRVLNEARGALAVGAAHAIEAGDLEDSERLLAEARALAELLTPAHAVARTTPSAQVEAVRTQRLRDQAELQRMEARIAQRRGRFTQARTVFAQAHALYAETLKTPTPAADVAAEQAELALLTGDIKAALKYSRVALADGQPGATQARAYRVQGMVRLRQGAWAPAFANANTGLQALIDANAQADQVPLRARLHTIAGVTLIAVGYTGPGLERLAAAAALDPVDLDTARTAAQAHAAAGQFDQALALLDGASRGPRGREARVLKGCVLSLAGRHEAALQFLSDAQGLSLPHVRAAGIAGRACMAHSMVATGKHVQAQRLIAPIRAELANPSSDPALAWRVLLTDGQAALARGDVLTAARRWRLALARYDELAHERAERGFTADLAPLSAPKAPAVLLSQGPGVFTAAAAKASADEREALLKTALSAALYARATEASPAGDALLEVNRRPASAEAEFRAALGRTTELRMVLGDAAVRHNDRVRLVKALSAAVKDIARGRSTMARQAPAWTAYVAPRLHPAQALMPAANEALAVYHVGPKTTHLWLAIGDMPMRHYTLPGRDTLSVALTPAFHALKTPPNAWLPEQKRPSDPNSESWGLLSAPVMLVLPFLRDAADDLTGKTLRIVPDGPLVRLPFGALVLNPPAALGNAPTFFGTQYTLRTQLDLRPVSAATSPAKTLGAFGPLSKGTDCPPGPGALDLCTGADQAAEAEELQAAFAVAPAQFERIAGTQATSAAFERALAAYKVLHVISPVDVAQGAILTSATKGGPHGRLSGKAFAMGGATGAQAVILSRPSAQSPTDALGLRRLAAALRLRGVQQLILVATRTGVDPERAGALAAHLAQGKGLAAALRTIQDFEAKAAVNVVEGGETRHHPYLWGRWLRFD
jgi:tetratricopeptide (TPR) repeat protein